MAITPDVSPMEAGSTVGVASKTKRMGVGSIAVMVVFLDEKTMPVRLVLNKTKPKTIRKKTKNFMDCFIAGLSIT